MLQASLCFPRFRLLNKLQVTIQGNPELVFSRACQGNFALLFGCPTFGGRVD